jgi:hypothetical protein
MRVGAVRAHGPRVGLLIRVRPVQPDAQIDYFLFEKVSAEPKSTIDFEPDDVDRTNFLAERGGREPCRRRRKPSWTVTCMSAIFCQSCSRRSGFTLRQRIAHIRHSESGTGCGSQATRPKSLRVLPDSVPLLPPPISGRPHPRQHGGRADPDNLAYSCLHSNRHKGPNIAGRDPETGEVVRLFHPRKDSRDEHFRPDSAILTGLTPIGRVTVHVLAMNDSEFLEFREALIKEGVYPE